MLEKLKNIDTTVFLNNSPYLLRIVQSLSRQPNITASEFL